MSKSWLFIVLFLLPLWRQAPAAQQGANKVERSGRMAESDEPITITSDRMEIDQKKNTIVYKGNVVTVRGELTMKSDSLAAVYDLEAGLKEVVAEGNVRVNQRGREAVGNRAIFNSENETITMTGNPVVKQGNSQISGDRIIFYMKEDRGVVEGGSQRVKAVIFPKELNKNE